jgi:hypothetical protein
LTTLPGSWAVPLARCDDPGDLGFVELGRPARVAFAASYLSVQTLLVATGVKRPDHAFAFQMFSESTTVRVTLLREIEAPSGHGTWIVDADHGEWTALDTHGKRRSFEWGERVREPSLASFDVTFEAPYGQNAFLSRFQAALDDVTAHLDGDAETRRLWADVTVRKNGREPSTVRLSGPPRKGSTRSRDTGK